MALNYYKFTFDNKQEYIIIHESTSVKDVITDVSRAIIGSEFMKLSHNNTEPTFIKKDRLFSIQKQPPQTIGAQQRLWTLN